MSTVIVATVVAGESSPRRTQVEGGIALLLVGAFVRRPTRIVQLEPAVATADDVIIVLEIANLNPKP